MHPVADRFLRYVRFDTRADSESTVVPSSPGQMDLARLLQKELQDLGLENVRLTENAYVLGTLPGNAKGPSIGFLAHLDTACEASGANVNPRIVFFDGSPVALGAGLTLSVEQFPDMAADVGKHLVVTDGTTLLGADDKAGIAEIMTALAHFVAHPEIPHGPIQVAFVPDEEIGHGASLLDIHEFGADFAYTLDGTGIGTIEYENFNAALATVRITGVSVHPGHSKGLMVNALLVAQALIHSLPKDEIPASTEGRQGFFHLLEMTGGVGEATLRILVRDHDSERFAQRKTQLADYVAAVRQAFPQAAVDLDIRDQYANMLEKVRPHMHIVDNAMTAITHCGLTPCVHPIRGGTDGAQLSWRGLPCPNLFCGDHNAHGPYEYVAVEDMEKAVDVILHIVRSYAAQN